MIITLDLPFIQLPLASSTLAC